MTHGAILLAGFVVVLVIAALVFLDRGSKPPVVPDGDSVRDRRLGDQSTAQRRASASRRPR